MNYSAFYDTVVFPQGVEGGFVMYNKYHHLKLCKVCQADKYSEIRQKIADGNSSEFLDSSELINTKLTIKNSQNCKREKFLKNSKNPNSNSAQLPQSQTIPSVTCKVLEV